MGGGERVKGRMANDRGGRESTLFLHSSVSLSLILPIVFPFQIPISLTIIIQHLSLRNFTSFSYFLTLSLHLPQCQNGGPWAKARVKAKPFLNEACKRVRKLIRALRRE